MSEHMGAILWLILFVGLGVGFLAGWMAGTFHSRKTVHGPDVRKVSAVLCKVSQYLRTLSDPYIVEHQRMAEEVDKVKDAVDPPPVSIEALR